MGIDDYIPPKMFTFCSRCGETCQEGGKDFMCLGCQKSLLGLDIKEPLIKDEKLRAKVVGKVRQSIGETLSEHLKPKWWILRT